MRPDIARPCYRIVLALPPGDRLDDDTWLRLAQAYLVKLGIDADNHQHSVVLHLDTGHHHVHVTVNRVGLDGTVWSRSNDGWKGRKAVAELEREFRLTLTLGESADIRQPTQRELAQRARTSKDAPRVRMLKLVSEALDGSVSLPGFLHRAERMGLTVRANVSGDRVNGLSFAIDGHSFKASKLGRQFGWANLAKRLRYDPERDLKQLRLCTANPPSEADLRREEDAQLLEKIMAEHDQDLAMILAIGAQTAAEAGEAERAANAAKVPANPQTAREQAEAAILMQGWERTKGGSVLDLIAWIEARGVTVRANVASTGKVSGLAFRFPGQDRFRTASSVGKELKWANLTRTHRYAGSREEIEELRLRVGVWTPAIRRRVAPEGEKEAQPQPQQRPAAPSGAAPSPVAPAVTSPASAQPTVQPQLRMILHGASSDPRTASRNPRDQVWTGYRCRAWPEHLVAGVRFSDDGIATFPDGTRISDRGDALVGIGDAALLAEIMAIEAQARGWNVLRASGDKAFLRAMAERCHGTGMRLIGETPEMEAVIAAEWQRLDAARKRPELEAGASPPKLGGRKNSPSGDERRRPKDERATSAPPATDPAAPQARPSTDIAWNDEELEAPLWEDDLPADPPMPQRRDNRSRGPGF